MTNDKARDLLTMIEVKEPKELIVNSWWESFVKDYKEALETAMKALEQEPKTGHWIDNKARKDLCNCSECGALSKAYTKYCHNCGAKME